MTSPAARILALVAVLALGSAIGLLLRARQGRARAVRADRPADRLVEADLGTPLGDRATLLQVSTEVCAPCRVARRVLGSVAERTPGVRHVELDADEHLALVRRLGVLRTPSLFVLDAEGRVVARSSGVPTPAQVDQALALAGVGDGDDLADDREVVR